MGKYRTAVKSIHYFCRHFCRKGWKRGTMLGYRTCPNLDCPLYPFRKGKRPTKRQIEFFEYENKSEYDIEYNDYQDKTKQ